MKFLIINAGQRLQAVHNRIYLDRFEGHITFQAVLQRLNSIVQRIPPHDLHRLDCGVLAADAVSEMDLFAHQQTADFA